MSLTRRQFVARSAAVAAVGLPMVARSSVLGANETIRFALVGCGGRGGAHVSQFGSQPGVQITAVCDPDRQRLESYAKRIEQKHGNKVEQVVDVRRLMERKGFDVVSVATMQHWHALPTIWACQSGRHVYCEKPLAHFIWEGRQMVNAARKYDRLVQIGTQARSRATDRQAREYILSGALGKIKYIVCFANKPRTPIGKRSEPLPIPETLDYDLWCGPAKKEPIYRDRIQYDCSFTWNMGDGESCNQGVHEIDIARWVLGETGLPRRVMSLGGRFVFNDAGDVPNTQIAYYDFATAPILYEVHNMRKAKDSKDADSYLGARTDTCVHCEGGYVMMHAGIVRDNQGKEIKRFSGKEDHFGNFVRALRTGRREDLNAEILEGHRSTNICHAGNISYRLGKQTSVKETREQIGNLPVFQEMFDRYVEHLKRHEVDAGQSTVGPWLEADGQNERFKGDDRANQLVRGFYRESFAVPEVKI